MNLTNNKGKPYEQISEDPGSDIRWIADWS